MCSGFRKLERLQKALYRAHEAANPAPWETQLGVEETSEVHAD